MRRFLFKPGGLIETSALPKPNFAEKPGYRVHSRKLLSRPVWIWPVPASQPQLANGSAARRFAGCKVILDQNPL
jgi:hypothetical protein